MLSYRSLFIRHGWLLEDKGEDILFGGQVFDCTNESPENVQFLLDTLLKAGLEFEWEAPLLRIKGNYFSEKLWLKALDFEYRGRTEMLVAYDDSHQPEVSQLDTYIAGVVRQLNRLGFYTMCSCDGNGKRPASISIEKKAFSNQLIELLNLFTAKKIHYRKIGNGYKVKVDIQKSELLDLAENLSVVKIDWLKEGMGFIDRQRFEELLTKLLNIPGVSGKESEVRKIVMEELSPFVDHMKVDHYGNVIAEKTYGLNGGPTILLNAHLDTVDEIEQDRILKKDGPRWSSSEGILGADDRAGVTVVLKMAQYLATNSNFRGKVKFILTVEEEIGLVGALQVDDHFLWDVNAAFVIDRRGTGDIVTHNRTMPFCSVEFGNFIEDVAKQAGLIGWKCVQGGSSDTRIWAQHGIQSVNLSAGYMNEHTDLEYLDVDGCWGTVKLLKSIFENRRGMRQMLHSLERVR